MTEVNKQEFSSIHLLALIVKHKYFVFGFTLLSTLVAVIISFFVLKNEYKSTVNVVPPQQQDGLQGAMTAISSTLRDIGLSKLTGKSASDNYSFIVILMSRTVMDSIINEFDLINVYKVDDGLLSEAREELENNLEITYEKDGNYFISVWDKDPVRAARMANRIVEIANNIAIRIFREEVKLNKENMEARLRNTDSTIKAIADTLQKFSKRTLLFSPTEQAKSITQALSDLKAEEIKYDILYQYYKNIYGANDYLTQSIATIKEETAKKVEQSKNLPGFAGNFAITDAAQEGIEFLRLYTEFETYSKVKAFLLPIVEQNRIDEVKNIKNLIVLDPATPADKKDRPKRSLIIAGTFLGSFFLVILLLALIYAIKDTKEKLKKLDA